MTIDYEEKNLKSRNDTVDILKKSKRKINQRIEKILQFLYTVIRTANILIYIVPEQSAMTFLFQGANSARAVSVILVLGRRSSR